MLASTHRMLSEAFELRIGSMLGTKIVVSIYMI